MFFRYLDSLKNCTHFFDFDGVIVDSVEIKTEAYAEIFSQFGGEAAASWIREFHRLHGGVDRVRKIRLGLWYFAASKKGSAPSLELWDPPEGVLEAWEEQVEPLVEAFGKATRRRVEEAPDIPGVREYLESLSQNRTQMFVVSGAPEAELHEIVKKRGLWDYFTEVRGSPKHKTEILEELLARYTILPEQSVFFGDAQGDFQAAQNTGMLFVGFPSSAKMRE